MARKSAYQILLEQLLGSQKVRYFPILALPLGGAKAALLMSQLLYWHGKDFKGKSEEGWFWIAVDQMQAQTGLTPGEQRTARKTLQDLKVCEMELRGIPRRWHYLPDLEALGELLGSLPLVRKPNQCSLETSNNVDQETLTNIEGETPEILGGKPDQLNRNKEITKDIITKEDLVNIYSETIKTNYILALSNVTGMDENLNEKKLADFGEQLFEAGLDWQLIEKIYLRGGIWYSEDWRGKQGQLPNLSNIAETIGGLATISKDPYSPYTDGPFKEFIEC